MTLRSDLSKGYPESQPKVFFLKLAPIHLKHQIPNPALLRALLATSKPAPRHTSQTLNFAYSE